LRYINLSIGVNMSTNNEKEEGATKAGVAGATAGAAGSIGTVYAAGAVTGLGATGITSGLAAVGGVVGGGMATGLAITAAAPLAIGGAAYGLYKLFTD
jgi:hypothetical protein